MSHVFYALDSLEIMVPIDVEKFAFILPEDKQMKNLYNIWLKLADLMKILD